MTALYHTVRVKVNIAVPYKSKACVVHTVYAHLTHTDYRIVQTQVAIAIGNWEVKIDVKERGE